MRCWEEGGGYRQGEQGDRGGGVEGGTVPRSSRGVNCKHSSFRTLKSAPLPDVGRQQRGKGLQHDTIHLAEDEGEVGRCAWVIACKPAHAVPPHVVHAVRQEEEGRVRHYAVRRG